MPRPIGPNGPTTKVCRHPGCDIVLRYQYTTFDSGFCRLHGGQRKGRAPLAPAEPPPPAPTRAGVRMVMMPVTAISTNNAPLMAPVSLPKEPWL
jgi:hypothetical protein